MPTRGAPRSFAFFLLMMPRGISFGFATILVPFLIVRAGLSVAVAGSVTAMALLPNVLSALWGPLMDVSLTFRRWYQIGLLISLAALLSVGVIPLQQGTVWMLTVLVFLSELGVNLIFFSVGGIIAVVVDDTEKGRAAGWFQAAWLGGAGLSGGGGVWLITHLSAPVACTLLSMISAACALALLLVPVTPSLHCDKSLGQRFREFGLDLLELIRSPEGLFVTIIDVCPIGVGAVTNLWAAVSFEWHASANFVAFATGIVNGIAAALGCVVSGWIADRYGRYVAFFGASLIQAGIAVLLANAPRSPMMFGLGILLYAISQGGTYAAFTAITLHVLGSRAVATKYAVLTSLGYIPISYMTAFDGFAHDRWGTSAMLLSEALLGVASTGLGLFALWRTRRIMRAQC